MKDATNAAFAKIAGAEVSTAHWIDRVIHTACRPHRRRHEMVQVTELGYKGIGVKNPDEWKNFAKRRFSFYVQNTSGWTIEYGWAGRPASYQSEYSVEDIHGHQPETGDFGGEGEPH